MNQPRLSRVIVALALLAIVASVSGYAGAQMGRHYEFNKVCCGVPKRHDMLISVKEALGLLTFHSQIGQDRWIAEAIFPGVTNGYFLDVGSADGVINSNSWALEQRGWSGICVDPFPTNMTGRRCQMFKEAVDDVGGRHVHFKQAGEVGGITDFLGRTKSGSDTAPTVDLTTVTLADILDRAKAPSFIHYLSLDIEGAELAALRGFPFDRYRLGAIDVEHNFEEPKRSDIEKLLNAQGYVRDRTWMQDDFYLPRQR